MPSTSKKQQRFMQMEYAKALRGEPTKTKMNKKQLKDFTKLA